MADWMLSVLPDCWASTKEPAATLRFEPCKMAVA